MENHLNEVADAILRYLDADEFETFTAKERMYESVFHLESSIDTAVLHLKNEGMGGYVKTLDQITKMDSNGYAIKITPEGSEFINRTSFVAQEKIKQAQDATQASSITIIHGDKNKVSTDQSSNKTEATKAPTTIAKKIAIGIIAGIVVWLTVQFVLMPWLR